MLNARGIIDLEDAYLRTGHLKITGAPLAVPSLMIPILAPSRAIRLVMLEAMDEVGLSRETWVDDSQHYWALYTNKPGVFAYLAGLVSRFGGNILRTVNTFSDGSFTPAPSPGLDL